MSLHQCPCCDFFTLSIRGDWEICPICFWEDDGIDLDRADRKSGPNYLTLRAGRQNFQRIGACCEADLAHVLPRAEWTKCVERYVKSIPFYHFRHLVKPGITGWAQVNYPYGESDEDAIEKLKYDLYYIRNYSLKLDLMIVLKTVHTVLFGKGQ